MELLGDTFQAVKPSVAGVKYYEIKKDGRIYVFTSTARKLDFEKSGEQGKGIIKIGYGPKGETVVFDSDEAVGSSGNRQRKEYQLKNKEK
ncbi:MAG: hypothetical protein GY941_20060 [Planctomycetes bacterium]|nr:hypothetical protein [Planctomycetota bacterium]